MTFWANIVILKDSFHYTLISCKITCLTFSAARSWLLLVHMYLNCRWILWFHLWAIKIFGCYTWVFAVSMMKKLTSTINILIKAPALIDALPMVLAIWCFREWIPVKCQAPCWAYRFPNVEVKNVKLPVQGIRAKMQCGLIMKHIYFKLWQVTCLISITNILEKSE